ncbi:uncharacterized protein [Phyllobates terribilis]|uniref:uncharacterized protein n=1 Tax=Phyllobates terribilis TaxID=111132 RepID=UPI003CCB0C20
MLKDNNNFRFSPKKSENALIEDYRRELEVVKKELESEKLKTQEVRKKCTSELKRNKEIYEKEKRKLADDLKSKLEQQKTRELQQVKISVLREREIEIKQLMRWKDEELRELKAFLQKERDTAIRQARDLQQELIDELLNKGYTAKSSHARKAEHHFSAARECKCKLQDVLSKIRWEYDGEQAARIRHLKVELSLARSLFIKYMLSSNTGSLLTILEGNSKPLDCEEIKFGRHSLDSRTPKPWSPEDVCSGPQHIENIRPRPQSHESALSRVRSLDCMLTEHESTRTSIEKLWKLTPETEVIKAHDLIDCHENDMSDIVPCLDARNDFLTCHLFENGVHQLSDNISQDISALIGVNNCTSSIETLDSNQSHGEQHVGSLQLLPGISGMKGSLLLE